MLTEHDWIRLARYVAGECPADEADVERRWIDSDPERREALAFLSDVNGLAAAGEGQPEWGTPAAWERLAARMSARERPPLVRSPHRPSFSLVPPRRAMPLWQRPALRAAAAIAVLVSASLPWLWPRLRGGAASEAGAGQGEMREYVTARGQRLHLWLADSTQIILGVASRLRLPVSFGRSGGRDVHLEGEAYFDVRYDPQRPFRVHTAMAVTEDIGTQFSVLAYDTDTTVRVVVAEGSVELRALGLPPGRRGALLTAGQLGVLAASGDALVRSDIDVARELAWTQGKLVFDDVPLRDALPRLSRWYDLDFVLADSALGARLLTASFSGESLPETLRLLGATLDARAERSGRTVTFYPNTE